VTIEVHPQPGVMDPAAQSVRDAVQDLAGLASEVSTGIRYDLTGLSDSAANQFAKQTLANPVIHQINTGPWHPTSLPKGYGYSLRIRHIPVRDLTDEQLTRLSRDAHLFLSLEEMVAVRDEYRALKREPTDIELETIAQTWSEHCVHKTLKANVRYTSSLPNDPIDWTLRGTGRPGHAVESGSHGTTVTIRNLLKSTIAAATHELMADGIDWTLSVFKDNSGVVAFDQDWGVNIKVETHNRPSAIEPYGGAATGAGGCIRDVIGTGLGARPLANTDVFCVAMPENWSESAPNGESLPPGTLPPKRTLSEVVAGVRDYGNRMGIPTVNGAVSFDDRYIGNPLVFCGCIGLIPRALINGAARRGERIIALGGRTGRDGIHGATFSSAELESTTSTEFSHAVQIGNAIEEKRLLEAIMRARDAEGGPLYHGMTDCGAGGFSSAIGEMASEVGAEVHLDRAPLKYAGLSYTEIWISEAQERMILSVPEENIVRLKRICDEERVELADLGQFGTERAELVLRYQGTEVGRLPMAFLHDGIPTPTRPATWSGGFSRAAKATFSRGPAALPSVSDSLFRLLGHPNIASKHWIIRQYDHAVQGHTVINPLVGKSGRGPSDAAVLSPVPTSKRGVAIACGLQTPIGDATLGGDPYLMAIAAIDECVRNLVCVGADPGRIAILDNFCWPGCDRPENLGALVRACEGCYDGAKAYRTPFVSGKDSLNNQLRYTDPNTGEQRVIEIPYTLLITGLGFVPDTTKTVTMDAKRAGNSLVLIGGHCEALRGSLFATSIADSTHASVGDIPSVDLRQGPMLARAVHALMAAGLVESAHDCSDGGLLVSVAEMLIATTGVGHDGSPSGSRTAALGATIDGIPKSSSPHGTAFSEAPSRYVLEVRPENVRTISKLLSEHSATEIAAIGSLTDSARLLWKNAGVDAKVDDLAEAWLRPLDW
jgi:phosphoribosylformylglycinamidine synthase